MPIYEYACDDCGTRFEKLVRRAETSEVQCPSCGHDHLTTQYSTFTAQTASTKKDSPAPQGCGGGMCQGGMCGMNPN